MVHLLLFWEHPLSPGANTSLACHNYTFHRGPGFGVGAPRLSSRLGPAMRGAGDEGRPREGRPGSAGGAAALGGGQG